MKKITGALKQESFSDYLLETQSVWLTVKGFSVYIKKTSDGVTVDLYKLHEEAREVFASTYALDSQVDWEGEK